MQLKYKAAYGLRLYLCTNEPEICSFMTNDLAGGKLSIMKCSDCQDGYLIVRRSRNGGCFLGCSNYKTDGTGCSSIVSMREYYKSMGYEYPDKELTAASDRVQADRQDKRAQQNVRTERVVPQSDKTPGREQAVPQPDKTPEGGRPDGRENWEQEMLEKSGKHTDAAGRFPEYKDHSLFVMAETVLHALVHISDRHYFGVSMLADVLRGLKSEKIARYHLDVVAEYGSMAFLTKSEVMEVIGWLIDRNYILQTKGRYPVLHITNLGLNYRDYLTPRNMKSLMKRLGEAG